MKLTKSVVDRTSPPATGQTFYRDTVLQGFALRVTAGGAKSFVIEKRIKGRVRRKTLGKYGALTVEQARIEAQKFLGQVASGVDPIAEQRAAEARNVTLNEVFEEYLAVRKGLKPSTVKDYRYIVQSTLSDWCDRPLANISRDAVARRHQRLGQKSPARANNAMRVLRALFNFAQGQYEDAEGRTLFPENPVKRLSHTRAWYPTTRRRTVIKRTQLPAWYEAVMALKASGESAQADAIADFLRLLLFTGLRKSEGLRLKWPDVDLAERTLTIEDTKNREPLVLPLSDYLVDLLEARKRTTNSVYVFAGEGEHGHLIEPRKQMRHITEHSGVEFCLHDLRRTFITIAEGLDIPVYAIKHLVNHKMNHDVTAGYVIMDVERLRTPMQKITDYLLAHIIPQQDSNIIEFTSKTFGNSSTNNKPIELIRT